MKLKFTHILLSIGIIILNNACIMEKKEEATINLNSKILAWQESTVSMEDSIFDIMYAAHGSEELMNHTYEFQFRNKEYLISNKDGHYVYQVHVKTDTSDYIDYLKDGIFTRKEGDNEVDLPEKEISKHAEALNSVIYFASLPSKLKDNAVNRMYRGVDTIKGKSYFILKVFFDEENGGKDFEDEYRYWINTETHEIDYLAYNYSVNNGGVRFRAAYNKRRINDVLFQDYINYKAHFSTPLEYLPELYEQNQLEELSRIETENINLLE